MSTGASFARGSSKQDYETPSEFIAAVKSKFGIVDFAWDLAADARNAKAPNYISEREDSLSVDWERLKPSGDNWLNPPFDRIAPWAKKCADTMRIDVIPESRCRIFLLVPAAVGSNWFAEHVYGHASILALNGRICFDGKAPYPKDCLLAIYGGGLTEPGFGVWRWK
jgi:phage N-6-adenine-methyltransferase